MVISLANLIRSHSTAGIGDSRITKSAAGNRALALIDMLRRCSLFTLVNLVAAGVHCTLANSPQRTKVLVQSDGPHASGVNRQSASFGFPG